MTTTVQTALFLSGIGMVGIFIFMAVFYLIILLLDKYLPHKEEKPEEN